MLLPFSLFSLEHCQMGERHVALLSTLSNLLMQRVDSLQKIGFSFPPRIKHDAFQCAAVEQLVLHQLLRSAQIILVNTFDEQTGQQSHRLTNRHVTWNDVLHPPERTFTVLRSKRLGRSVFCVCCGSGENASSDTLP
ncbi:hypothetical protein WJ23_12880 [Burkholderia lata]|nr:hypothetical protein WJ23_12880 [Burkholderia lata]